MLKIGDFSKLAHVTVKTLRHYARIGLFRPAWIDRFSGYRYYSLQQLPALNRILALKDLGFSLEQIGQLVEEDVPVEQMRGMLRRKQAELEARLRLEQGRLAMVAARLQQIERAGIAAGQVLVKRVEALPVASVREVIPSIERLAERTAALTAEIKVWLAVKGSQALGPWMALYSAPEYRERDIPFELAAGVDWRLLGAGSEVETRVRLQLLPAVEEMACLVHVGPAAAVAQAYADLYAWMEANQRRPGGPARELLISDSEEDGRMIQAVEVQLPLEPSAQSLESLSMSQKESKMQPKLVNLPAFSVVGLCYHGSNQNNEIAAMWGEFNQRGAEVAAIAVPNSYAYGVCSMQEGLPEYCFEYVAGLQTPPDVPVPEGMVMRHVAAHKYVVYEHRGAMDTLQDTYKRIHTEWMPQAGLEPAEAGLDMEVYTEEFDNFSPASVFYIYVPVK